MLSSSLESSNSLTVLHKLDSSQAIELSLRSLTISSKTFVKVLPLSEDIIFFNQVWFDHVDGLVVRKKCIDIQLWDVDDQDSHHPNYFVPHQEYISFSLILLIAFSSSYDPITPKSIQLPVLLLAASSLAPTSSSLKCISCKIAVPRVCLVSLSSFSKDFTLDSSLGGGDLVIDVKLMETFCIMNTEGDGCLVGCTIDGEEGGLLSELLS
ncbi:hypothetical protein Tco_1092136 [Tanacetum coccineum]|uniref:F-box protein n=1 Tax=Tanacetum coccineum TaxID=301880 RepID=A0ABQ5I920_9ASTR